MLTVLLFIAILCLLVIVHEFGHFITARLSGMRVYEFGMGFPPRLFGVYRDPHTKKFVWVWGKKKARSSLSSVLGGEPAESEFPATLYSLNSLPLGGFCQIKGENGADEDAGDSFGSQKAWKRLIVLLAGVGMNMLLAAGLFAAGFMIGLPTDLSQGADEDAIVVEQPTVVAEQVLKDSPAAAAGMAFGDKILWLDGEPVRSASAMQAYVRSRGEAPIRIGVSRNGASMTFEVTPKKLNPGDDAPKIGVILADAGIVRYPWHIALWKGFVAAWYALINTFIGFYFLLKGLILGQGMAFEVAGPVGIAVVVGESARMGLNYLLNVTAMISVSLAAVNILPIPALDGGRALFVILEKALGRRIPIRYEQVAHTIGFVLLLIMILLVTFRDIMHL